LRPPAQGLLPRPVPPAPHTPIISALAAPRLDGPLRRPRTMQGGTSFSQWFDEVQRQEQDTKTSGSLEDGTGIRSVLNWFTTGSESGPEVDPESQSFLSTASSWVPFRSQDPNGPGTAQQAPNLFGLSYQTRFKAYVSVVLLAMFFFTMAFMVGLPVIVLRPHKFALCFTIGSLLFMSSYSLLVGPGAHLRSMIAPDRLPLSGLYVISMLATLYASLVVRSYLLVVATSSVQIATLGYYFLSSIPGGVAGFKVFVGMFSRVARVVVGPCLAGMWKAFSLCLKLVSS